MPDLLLELLSEEIPASMQARAAEDLCRLVEAKLAALQLSGSSARSYVTPRRLALVVEGLPERQPDREIEVKGPRVGAPEQAIAGFLRSAGLASIDQTEIRDTGKGSFHFAVSRAAGQSIEAALVPLLTEVLDTFPWPKSMRWGEHTVRWVRPLHNILAILTRPGSRTIVPLAWVLDRGGAALTANAETCGHRFMAPEPFEIDDFADYQAKLRAGYVMLDPAERKRVILEEGAKLAAAQGLRVKDDPGLLDEVAGLVEWPVVRIGRIEPRFMDLPGEVLTVSMRTHQKYFACETSDGKVAPFFIVVGNNETRDGGAAMVAGNERVLRARLSDAQFFWDLDRKTTLRSRIEKLKERVFHAKLGSIYDKAYRMVDVARGLLGFVDKYYDSHTRDMALQAAEMAKADLSSALVGEFPELQGVMGRYLALNDHLEPEIANAIGRHYAPAGLSDTIPTDLLGIVVAIADKIDTLAGFFAIGEKPTGSKDPFALRRAALGVIRIILGNDLRIPLSGVIRGALREVDLSPGFQPGPGAHAWSPANEAELLNFFADRLKVFLRDQGIRHDLVAAVFALGNIDDLVLLRERARALQEFLFTDDGANLLIAYRRASKIAEIEGRKDGLDYRTDVLPLQQYGKGEFPLEQLEQYQEKELANAMLEITPAVVTFLEREDFTGAMAELSKLRRPLDDFFEHVTVNVENRYTRRARLRLLGQIWALVGRVADFSKIEG
ncbi:MAG: glycine--tRNA ligase subunit beta [Aliidongia sp.]